MDAFKIIYTMLGGLGIFFYGMKMMSESLQSMAGDVIRKVINSLTSNRLLAVVVGVIVTMIIQSSSVTTVMVVGFVNAGLMSLSQAIGVIFGANIGTTITGWIISIKVGKYGLLFIGLGIFPALFSKSNRWKNIGTVWVGIGMIFLGLETMSAAFKPLRTNQSFLDSISYFAGNSYGSYAASILMGCILTVIIQSSSAMLGITIALASTGIIEFNTAAALVFGENIGTTITALLASVGGNVNAKRAARAHAIFNLLGVFVLFWFIPVYVEFIERIIPGAANFISADGSKPYIAAHIAASHSIFNVTNTLLFIPFLGVLAKLVIKLTPEPGVGKDTHHLVMLGNASDVLPATAIVQCHEEIKKFKEILDRMYKLTHDFLSHKDSDAKALAKIKDYERITDNIQKEVMLFLGVVMEKPLSHAQSLQTQSLVRIADEYESIADYMERLATYKVRFNQNFVLEGAIKEEFINFMEEVWNFVNLMSQGLYEGGVHDPKIRERASEKLRIWADDLRDKHIDRVSKGEYDPLSALTYSDMVVALRKVRAHAMNVSQAIDGLRNIEG
jgi:phosphate:Na+ symporter